MPKRARLGLSQSGWPGARERKRHPGWTGCLLRMRWPELLLLSRLGRSGGFLLLAVNGGLEVRARAELGHRRSRDLDGRAGGRVTRRAPRPLRLLEHTEAGNGDLVARGHGGLDGVQHRVHGVSGSSFAAQLTRDRVDQITLVHVVTPAVPPREVARNGHRG